MKKIVLLLLTLTIITSCLRREDRHEHRTAYGATLIYEGLSEAVVRNEYTLLAVDLDIIAQTPIEKRDSVADFLFPNFKFRIDGNKYCLTRDNEIYAQVETDNQTLTTVGAKWKITKLHNLIPTQTEITVSCLTTNSWLLEIINSEQGSQPMVYNCTLASQRTAPDITPTNAGITLAFNKSTLIDPIRNVTHTITTDTVLHVSHSSRDNYYEFDYYYYYGVIHLYFESYMIASGDVSTSFINPTSNKEEDVVARFKRTYQWGNWYNETLITYQAITDTWHWNDIRYYGHQNCYY